MLSKVQRISLFIALVALCAITLFLAHLTSSPVSQLAASMSVTHVVLFQFKKEVSPEAVRNLSTRMLGLKDKCLHPLTQKPYILSSSGGVDMSIEGIQNGMTHAFVVNFASKEDRDYYVQKDPMHQDFVKSAGEVLEKAQVVDFINGEL
ncbi:hypothetical protein TRV_03494 [Trichophyton verrucosum HKI 0517]|uniref:Stress-response A/B barrel domain-containing protein n=1 Tax=Trichophyton verrucosum (strain HKI 0517) TaxID=663202 RepID=D4D8Q7_TRIVH|nr:uncharacterized protein TRV_03494 [Trichophyton verrucosum HKI 0517]EFE41812.1 hypothetical protein TRV_03494 [Trichophyton verrucosum HKI 0517]